MPSELALSRAAELSRHLSHSEMARLHKALELIDLEHDGLLSPSALEHTLDVALRPHLSKAVYTLISQVLCKFPQSPVHNHS